MVLVEAVEEHDVEYQCEVLKVQKLLIFSVLENMSYTFSSDQ